MNKVLNGAATVVGCLCVLVFIKNRWKIRSKTYDGIATAMADQWSGAVINERVSQ